MSRWLRRLVLMGLVGAASGVIVGRVRRRVPTISATQNTSPGTRQPAQPPTWPPLHRDTPASAPDAVPGQRGAMAGFGPDTVASVAPNRWVTSEAGGTCPPGYPVKANDKSGIYHVPGGRFYARTVPERCYSEAADAAADGYRAAKA